MIYLLNLCLTIIGITSQILSTSQSVCKDNKEPYDPDQCRDTRELIKSRGFDYEEHDIVTQDGYILTTFRIVHPMFLSTNETTRSVILQHGLLSSSRDWLINAPGGDASEHLRIVGNNLGFELAKRGYDVWITNSRGNKYSMNHVSISSKEGRFWDFSYADMAKYDVPACVDYVLNKTGRNDLAYVGYSQGTMMMWAALSIYPKLNEVVKPYIALAPVMSLQHISRPLRAIADLPLLPDLLGHLLAPFLPNNKFIRSVEEVFCKPPLEPICLSVVGIAGGFDNFMLNKTRMEVYAEGVPAGTSNKNLVLFAQNIKHSRFADFDYGPLKNMEVYGRREAPAFPIEDITNPNIAMISGLNDFLAPPGDVDVLRSRLRVKLIMDYVIPYEKWSHLDFAIGVEAGKYVNKPVLDVLKQFDP